MISIKESSFDDYEILCLLREKLLAYHHKINPLFKFDAERIKSSNELIKKYLRKEYSTFYIIYYEEKVAGYLHVTLDEKPQGRIKGYVQDLFILKECRGKGLGKKLLEKADEFFTSRCYGVTVDYVSHNMDVVNFYLKNGFKVDRIEEKIGYLVKG